MLLVIIKPSAPIITTSALHARIELEVLRDNDRVKKCPVARLLHARIEVVRFVVSHLLGKSIDVLK